MNKAENAFHKKEAARCFNRAWDRLEAKDRTPTAEFEMLDMAHASRYHWSFIGGPRNEAINDWQLARVYSVLGEPKLALRYARACLELCERENLKGLVHSANEALARAFASAGDYSAAKRHLAIARRQLSRAPLDAEGKKVYSDQLRETAELVMALRKS